MDNKLGLYIHIPFCRSKCAYCDFYSITDTKKHQRYIDSLILHMGDYSDGLDNYNFDTVFIGGGTPTIISKNLMIDLLDAIFNNFNITKDAEITIEANPATIDTGMLKKYHSEGINRLSIGMQSSCDNELRALTRIHTFDEFEESFRSARKAKFNNINIDLMYGIPEQTLASFKMTLDYVCDLRPEHISVYGLKIEENTPFADKTDILSFPNEDDEYAMYEMAVNTLTEQGYIQYEISNFALPGFECRHNLKYWNCMEYLGLGPGAHSYLNDCRFSFKRDIDLYMDAMEKIDTEFNILDECYNITPKERIGEYIMLHLRLNEGLNTEQFRDSFNLNFERIYDKYLKIYVDNGFMEKNNSNYSFTTKGRYVSNYILSAMLDFDSSIVSNIVNGTDKI
ncbi:MAG: radical SAM family heme chaperone HemW [Eubacteriales bacterium]